MAVLDKYTSDYESMMRTYKEWRSQMEAYNRDRKAMKQKPVEIPNFDTWRAQFFAK